MSWEPWTSLSSISPSPPPELPREHTDGSLTWVRRLIIIVSYTGTWEYEIRCEHMMKLGRWCMIGTSLARAEDPASTLAGTRVTMGEGVPDFEETSLPSSGDRKGPSDQLSTFHTIENHHCTMVLHWSESEDDDRLLLTIIRTLREPSRSIRPIFLLLLPP